MILQALNDLYERLADDASYELPRPGYSTQKVSFCVVIKPDGTLVSVSAQADPAVANQWVGYVVADQAGVWTVKASCTTPRAAVDQSTFTVMASLPG
jgi:hypothetical protein